MDKIWIKEDKFVELSLEQWKSLTEEQMTEYSKDKNEAFENRINSVIEKSVSKEDFEKFKEELKDSDIEKRLKQYDAMFEKMQASIEAKKNDIEEDAFKTMRSLYSEVRKGIKFDIKANALRSTVDSSTMAYRLDGVGRLASPAFVFTNYFSVINVPADNNGTIRYIDWDSTAVSRAAAAIAEGAVFPESTADMKEYSVSLEKVGDTIPVSEEFLQDVNFAQGELVWFLQNNVLRAENQYLWNGTGVTPQISGLYTRINAFAHATYSGPTTSTPDLVDLKDVLVKEILDERDGKYSMDRMVMFVNHDEFLEATLEKDTTGHRIWSASDLIAMGIIPTSFVTANTAAIGDMAFAKVYQNEAYNFEIGRDGNDFTYDLFTLKAKRRMGLVIREADVDGFLKVTDIDAALTAITT
jgi:HK97 family phage major capsid protein